MPTYLWIAVGIFLPLMGFGIGLTIPMNRAMVKSLADCRLRKIQDGNAAAFELWKVMRDDSEFGGAGADYFLGFSHALNLGAVITDEEWLRVRVATGGDS